jgi:hypothetical protein
MGKMTKNFERKNFKKEIIPRGNSKKSFFWNFSQMISRQKLKSFCLSPLFFILFSILAEPF